MSAICRNLGLCWAMMSLKFSALAFGETIAEFGVCADAYQRKIAQKVQFFVCDLSTGLLFVWVLRIKMLDPRCEIEI